MDCCAETVASEMSGPLQGLARALPAIFPDFHSVLHQTAEILREPLVLSYWVALREHQSRIAFLRYSESESRYSPRYTFLGNFRLLFGGQLRDVFILRVPHVPLLRYLVFDDDPLARTARAVRVELLCVAVSAFVVSDEQHVAETSVLRLLLETRTRGPTEADPVEFTRREILQFVLHVLEASAGVSHGDRRVLAVCQFIEIGSEVEVLLPPCWRVVACSSVMSPHSVLVKEDVYLIQGNLFPHVWHVKDIFITHNIKIRQNCNKA